MMGSSSGGPMAELMTKGASCGALTSGTCSTNSDCEWKAAENKCDLNEVITMQLMMGSSSGGPMAELMTKGAACNALNIGTCSANSDCEWKAAENKCDLNGAVALQLMMGSGNGGPMAELMTKGAACGVLNSGTCSANSDCEWKADESNCDLNGAIAMQLVMGSGNGGPMAELMTKGAACSALTSGTCSKNSDCEWDAHQKNCDVSTLVGINLMLSDCANNADLSLVAQTAKACLGLNSSSACTAYSAPVPTTHETASFAAKSAAVPLSLVVLLAMYFVGLL